MQSVLLQSLVLVLLLDAATRLNAMPRLADNEDAERKAAYEASLQFRENLVNGSTIPAFLGGRTRGGKIENFEQLGRPSNITKVTIGELELPSNGTHLAIGDSECGDHMSGDSQIAAVNTAANSSQFVVRNLFLFLFYKTNNTTTDEVLELENVNL